ncbi:ABC transporter permease [Streptomyces griseoviridis]|jgi:ABC-2 type transport system permease protein|uniref:Transport permease protein n=3 Tax=Streptomyces TaxID=1883 RepID=A0A918GDV0_STRGD|nr:MULTISPECIES: ABC transporter permease [Streptomyces]MDP9684126.1 ABC-2 type transport system permease protein [Streptomyces griseoviridis]GGS27678.1 transport permease protein [Streptomyces niveoruber]GGS84151.1 transport permease protein [Streptomyces griseoviridis]GGU45324.1 transport permease protein [Streptomyces daghestanicus]GHI30924.1 transport permease protein [Streptomyces daghestanicus]
MLLHDTALVYGRYLRQSLRSRFALLFGVLMPLLYLLFFGPLLTGLPLGGRGDSWQVLVPGLLLQLGLFGASFAGFMIILEKGQGVVERMRVTPVSRLALLLGRVLREATVFVFQAVLLVLAAVAMGLRAPLPGVLIGFGFVALLTVSLAALSYALAMKVATPQGFGPVVNALTMPAMLLSGLMLPMTLGPRWLDVLSHFMPFRYLVDALRDAYVGQYATAHMLYGVLVAVGLAVLSVAVGTRVFRTAGA